MAKIISILLLCLVINNSFSQQKLNKHQFPVPEKTSNLLFYVQRSLNSNTIIYDANFDKNGLLDIEKPIDIYWIRYDEEGQKMPLRFLEKQLAFGVNCEQLINSEYNFKITIAAWGKRAIYIRQVSPFKAIAYVNINGTRSILEHIFVGSDPGGNLYRAEYIELYGAAQKTLVPNYERIML
jgi:hypothetical protein